MNKFLTADEKFRKQMIEHVRECVNFPPQSIEKDLILALREEGKKLDRKDRKRKRIEKIESVYYDVNGDLSQIDLMIKQLGIPNVSKKYKAVSINGFGNDIRIVRKVEATLAYLGKMKLYKVV